ncbi:hypothetical protein MHOCP_12180 [Moorella humiferrea]|uniref:DUF3786 domain-containing protein n=1 Tax=Neomoorella humiferrea TaxID=676965 RepID=UPI0030D60284
MSLPYNLEVTLNLAQKKWAMVAPEKIAFSKGAVWEEKKKALLLPSLNDSFYIYHPDGAVTYKNNTSVEPRLNVLILHYLLGPELSLKGEWISFKELPGGPLYQQPFYGRAVFPLIRSFGQNPALLVKAGISLGGIPINHGTATVELYPFPKLPVRLVVWAGDEEIPPGGTILFDISATELMATEDYAVLAEYLVRRLQKQAGESNQP